MHDNRPTGSKQSRYILGMIDRNKEMQMTSLDMTIVLHTYTGCKRNPLKQLKTSGVEDGLPLLIRFFACFDCT
jgi:hypothetical protein